MIIKVTASSGHTACPGHTGGLGTERDVQVMDDDLGHGVCVHLINIYFSVKNLQNFTRFPSYMIHN